MITTDQTARPAERIIRVLAELHEIAEIDRDSLGRRDDAAVMTALRWLTALRKAGLLDTILQKELF